MFRGHGAHADSPVRFPYPPAWQGVHSVAAAPALIDPVAQATHTDAWAHPVYVPAEHGLQALIPVSPANFPMGQPVHELRPSAGA